VLVGWLAGSTSELKEGSGEQLKWVSTRLLMRPLLAFALGSKGIGFSVFIYENVIITRSGNIVNVILIRTPSLLTATLPLADSLGCSSWSCASEIAWVSIGLVRS